MAVEAAPMRILCDRPHGTCSVDADGEWLLVTDPHLPSLVFCDRHCLAAWVQHHATQGFRECTTAAIYANRERREVETE